MEKNEMINATESFVKRALEGEASGHDWWHIHRVRRSALRIGRKEGADLFICEMSALLHDVADEKLNESKEDGMRKIRVWLCSLGMEEELRNHIEVIVGTMSYAGGNGPIMQTIEGRVVQDADRLDALGAIGIARTFAYGGSKGHVLHDPGLPPRKSMTKEEYRRNPGTAIHHFYEKLFKLSALMNTEYGRILAEERTAFMEEFIDRFYKEWDGLQ
ncbi:HD domain-containing protein [Bacillus sp. 1P06AnD]|uniref:HD domain-containing protein n=1 Tax=Bacillus sp. 1P06AnD TaxID=3132208 RepID=UPI0039A20A41